MRGSLKDGFLLIDRGHPCLAQKCVARLNFLFKIWMGLSIIQRVFLYWMK